MHSFDGMTATFHFNSDLSGKVKICLDDNEILVEGKDLLDFVANYVRLQKISKLEQQDTYKVLGLK